MDTHERGIATPLIAHWPNAFSTNANPEMTAEPAALRQKWAASCNVLKN